MSLDAVIVGAGAAGLMCALRAAGRGRRIALIDHRRDFGRKILASGGGRCNFSNAEMNSAAFISKNRHFVKSALARFGVDEITGLLDDHRIGYREEKDGQLFLSGGSKAILKMFLSELEKRGVGITIERISSIERDEAFVVKGSFGAIEAGRLVVATGGLSYPKLGASDFGFALAKRFGHGIVTPRPGLVPLILSRKDRSVFSTLSGASCNVGVTSCGASLRGDMLFTHTGLSGPAILRISSRWRKGEAIEIDFLPDGGLLGEMEEKRNAGSRMELKTLLAKRLPSRIAAVLCERYAPSRPISSYSAKEMQGIERTLRSVVIRPGSTEGYAKAEVTVGGVETRELSSKTMESKLCRGLHFIGEVVDVTGDLGGYNLHWAWASGAAAGETL